MGMSRLRSLGYSLAVTPGRPLPFRVAGTSCWLGTSLPLLTRLSSGLASDGWWRWRVSHRENNAIPSQRGTPASQAIQLTPFSHLPNSSIAGRYGGVNRGWGSVRGVSYFYYSCLEISVMVSRHKAEN